MARSKNGGSPPSTSAGAEDYRHLGEKRKNIPPAKIAAEGEVPRVPKARYAYNPHLTPVLRSDSTGGADRLEELLAKAQREPLTASEAQRLAAALRQHQPWLEWAGKQEESERGYFEVDPVALHIHERVSTKAIIRAALREDVQRDLFADPKQPYREAVRFYKHDVDWANRLILGDSLQVMSSLAKREGLAAKVQMVYIDPPYGINFASNFQNEVNNRTVKESESDLARSVEMVKAYRDTWRLGVHSYLQYLRSRIQAAHELLHESGSIFVQIGEGNAGRVEMLLDEVFGPENRVARIVFRTKIPLRNKLLPEIADHLLWYAKRKPQLKFRKLYGARDIGEGTQFQEIQEPNGSVRAMNAGERSGAAKLPAGARVFTRTDLVSAGRTESCVFDFDFEGKTRKPSGGKSWKTNREGMRRLIEADRLISASSMPRYKFFVEDYPVQELTNVWTDTQGAVDRVYAVQTSEKVIQRCMLMCTDPGDLVLDPTIGSGTTAVVSEAWGRRWIGIDTSRVALAVARQRLVTATYAHYRTKQMTADGRGSPSEGFKYKTVPHITAGSVTKSTEIDAVFDAHRPLVARALEQCNRALKPVPEELRRRLRERLAEKAKKHGSRAVTEADTRRWDLPKDAFDDWNVPFDCDPDWPRALQDAVIAYRAAWQAKMEAVNACISRNADQEELVDQPEVVSGIIRVSGPFTVEGVRPEELSLGEDGLFDPTPNDFDDHDADAPDDSQGNLSAYLGQMVRLLSKDGVTFTGNKYQRFARVTPLYDAGTPTALHAEGLWDGASDDQPDNVAIAFGPQYGPVTAVQVEDLVRASRRYDELVIAGFSFTAEATATIQESTNPRLRIHQAYIRPDVNPGMDGLLKDTPGSQLFSVFGLPEIAVRKGKDGWVAELKGVDIYDPVQNTVRSTGAKKVAAWFLDQDFDGRCFCISQAFFPDQDAWEKIAKALKGHVETDAFERFNGTLSVPFEAGEHNRIAIKVIDPRGNEVMAIHPLKG